uniref:Putative nucleolar and coiled-body phosphoprotein 1-like isoform x2 n=1 Tax=Culex tarsalis TaxID=7177 RepID=A0A1Q3F1U0_CULTA
MCGHEFLMEKFTEHRKVHDRFLELFGTLFQTAESMKLLAADIKSNYDAMFLQLRKESSPAVEPPPQKRRKAHSFDSPAALRPDATSTGRCVDDAIDSSMVRNKSDPEVSTYSLLNQNIDLPDSEESFFALTQSPTVREPLSPRKDVSGQADNIQSTPPRPKPALQLDQPEDTESTKEKKRKKHNFSLGRFSTSFQMSPETNKQLQQLPVRQKMTTPKVKVEQQENLAPVGKWTAKKNASTSVGRSESAAAAALRRTPTSTGKDSTGSLLNRTRLRQTKLRFPDNKSSAADDNETYFDEFVVPSPNSFSGSRFFKSMRRKEQSSLIAAPPSSTATSNAAKDEDDDVFKSPEVKPRKTAKPVVDSDEDNFDIDQTYFSEAEKDLSRGAATKVVKVKKEPSSQMKKAKDKILAMDTPALEQGILDASGVEIVKPGSQDNVITIEESQPSRTDLFMEAIREEQRREQASKKTILDAMGPPPSAIRKPPESTHPFRSSPLRKFNTFGGGQLAPKPAPPQERRCIECTKHYRILELRGLTPDVILSKLARNCRECRQAQLHETPPGFWNPEFSPTQRT